MSTGVGVGVPTPRNPQERRPAGPSGDARLQEDNSYRLLENGGYRLLE